jgi:hypothetical protein
MSGSLAAAGRPRFGFGTSFVAFIAIFGFRALLAYINESDLRNAYRAYSAPFMVGEGARCDAGACFRSTASR